MDDYSERVINEFSMKISKSGPYLTPAGTNLFEKGNRKMIGGNKLKSSILQWQE